MKVTTLQHTIEKEIDEGKISQIIRKKDP